MSNQPKQQVWLVTGCATGIGYELASQLLKQGHKVVVTARKLDSLKPLADRYPDTTLVARLDINLQEEIARTLDEANAKFGTVDVLVNNAGLGYQAAIEEGTDEDIRWVFETNVFGTAALIRALLPEMRRRGSGTIVNMSSSAGFVGYAGLGYYCASRAALDGMTEALMHEVEPMGLKVLLVQLGAFRTGVLQRNRQSDAISDYAATAGMMRSTDDVPFPGDPARAATAVIERVLSMKASHRIVLGSDAFAHITEKIERLRNEYAQCAELSGITDYRDA